MAQIRAALESAAVDVDDLLTEVPHTPPANAVTENPNHTASMVLITKALTALAAAQQAKPTENDKATSYHASPGIPEQIISDLDDIELRQAYEAEGRCYEHNRHGTCGQGPDCKYSHARPPRMKVHMAKTRKMTARAVRPAPAKRNDVVIITQTCEIPALRGTLAQIHKIDGDRACIQLINFDLVAIRGGRAIQWIDMASSVGILGKDYTVCPPERKLTVLAVHASRDRYRTRGKGPYSLNAIFDTGSNTNYVVRCTGAIQQVG